MDQTTEETIAGRNMRLNRQAEELRRSAPIDTDAEQIAANEFMKRKDDALLIGIPVGENIIHDDVEQFLHLCKNTKYMLLRDSAWADIIGNPALMEHLNPITDYQKVLHGDLGDICGCQIYTDAFLYRALRTNEVAFKNSIIFVGSREVEHV
jgi:hypothetical protein